MSKHSKGTSLIICMGLDVCIFQAEVSKEKISLQVDNKMVEFQPKHIEMAYKLWKKKK